MKQEAGPEYRPLTPEKNRSAIAMVHESGQLYRGPDHAAHVVRRGLTVQVKRFDYADIHALTISVTNWQHVFTVLLLLAAAVAIGISLLVRESPLAVGLMGLLPLCLIAIGLITNFVRGPTCRMFLHTAVHDEELYGAKRLKVAHAVLAELQPAIAARQGRLE